MDSVERSRRLMAIFMSFCVLVLLGQLASPAYAQRQSRFFTQDVTNSPDFGPPDHGYNDPIEWTHSVPGFDLAAANSGGVIVDAWDVDYPAGTEHDRLLINGHDYGLLEGRNNTWGATEKSISVNHLQAGSNAFRVDPDELNQGWVLQIRRSTLYLYADEDFDIDALPASRTVSTTGTTIYQVRVDWIGIWDNAVNLSVSGLPGGAAVQFSPNPVTSNGGSSMMRITLSDVAPGTYPLTITGSGNADYEDSNGLINVVHTAEVDLIVEEGGTVPPRPPTGEFNVTATPKRRDIDQGENALYDVTAIFDKNWDSPVTLAVTAGLPKGATWKFSNNRVNKSGQLRKLTIATSGNTPEGVFTITITGKGTDSGKTVVDTAMVKLAIDRFDPGTDRFDPGTFAVTATPNRREINQGEEAAYDVTAIFSAPWDNPVTLEVTAGLPEGATWAFDNDTVNQSGQLRGLTIAPDTPEGTYTITITGTGTDNGGTVTDTTTAELEIGGSGFTLTAVPDEIEVELGQTVESTVTAEFFGACHGPVDIWISDASRNSLPQTINVKLEASVLQGEQSASTRLIAYVGPETKIKKYPVVIEGAGCGSEEPQQVTVVLDVIPVNIVITKFQSQPVIKPNMVQIYTLRLENKGETPATGLAVTDRFDSNLAYVSDTAADADHEVKNGKHTWQFNKTLPPGGAFSFNVNTRVGPFIRSGITVSNMADVTADQAPDPVVSNVVTAISGYEPVEPKGLEVRKRALKRDARVGGILIYRIEVKNISKAGPIFDIVLDDRMPNGFKIPSGKTVRDGALFDDPVKSGRTYTWRLGNLGPGEETVITYQAVVGTNANAGRNENTATARGVDGGGNRVSGSDSALVMLGPGDLEILGEITVTVYLDVNRNDVVDGADQPLEDIEIILIPPVLKQSTDENGETVFIDLRSREYLATVNEMKLDDDVHVTGEPSHLIRLLEGEHADTQFLLNKDPQSKLVGRVFYDNNNDKTFDTNDSLVDSFTVRLGDVGKTRGSKGKFVFTRLEPGTYDLVVEVDGKELSEKVDIKEDGNEVDVPVPTSKLNIRIRRSGN